MGKKKKILAGLELWCWVFACRFLLLLVYVSVCLTFWVLQWPQNSRRWLRSSACTSKPSHFTFLLLLGLGPDPRHTSPCGSAAEFTIYRWIIHTRIIATEMIAYSELTFINATPLCLFVFIGHRAMLIAAIMCMSDMCGWFDGGSLWAINTSVIMDANQLSSLLLFTLAV